MINAARRAVGLEAAAAQSSRDLAKPIQLHTRRE
jgi:hypothetical protein